MDALNLSHEAEIDNEIGPETENELLNEPSEEPKIERKPRSPSAAQHEGRFAEKKSAHQFGETRFLQNGNSVVCWLWVRGVE